MKITQAQKEIRRFVNCGAPIRFIAARRVDQGEGYVAVCGATVIARGDTVFDVVRAVYEAVAI